MCRHLAYLGAPRSLEALVMDPPHSLYEQSWAPRRQRHGTVNVDGFGAGWYVDRAAPVRYRRAQPIWTDASFASLAPTISTGCAVAAVRSATAGTSADEAAAAPFTHDRWLFSHNGRLHDWATARKALRPQVRRRARHPGRRGLGAAVRPGAGPAGRPGRRCPRGWPAPPATCWRTAGAG